MGAILLIYFYFRLIDNSFKVAEQVKDRFGTIVSVGIISILVLQVVINIGMVVGLFPVVGLTLPFRQLWTVLILGFSDHDGFSTEFEQKTDYILKPANNIINMIINCLGPKGIVELYNLTNLGKV